jgi:hypothetical protein
MFSNLQYDARVYETFKIVGEQTDNLHRRVMAIELRVLDLGLKRFRDTQRIENLETSVWFLKTLMLLMTVWIFCAMVLMRLEFEEANNKGIQFDNYLQGKVRLFEERFLDLEYR